MGYLNILIRGCLLHLSAIHTVAECINYSNLKKIKHKNDYLSTGEQQVLICTFSMTKVILFKVSLILKMTYFYFTLPPPN